MFSNDKKDHTVRNEECNKVLVRKSQGKGPFLRPKRRREDDFKVNHREVKDVMVWCGFTCFRLECCWGCCECSVEFCAIKPKNHLASC